MGQAAEAAIAAGDVIGYATLGERSASSDHQAALDVLRQSGEDAGMLDDLRWLLAQKNPAQYIENWPGMARAGSGRGHSGTAPGAQGGRRLRQGRRIRLALTGSYDRPPCGSRETSTDTKAGPEVWTRTPRASTLTPGSVLP